MFYMESDDNSNVDKFEHVKEVAQELYAAWENFSYGIPKKGKIENVPSAEYYDKHYRFLTPEEFEKYGGGICWDYVEWGDQFLQDKDVKVRKFYIWTETPPNWDTHTFIVLDCGEMDRYVYVESSFKLLKGVWIHNSLDEIIDTITWNMFKCNDNARRFDQFRYVVFEFTGKHPDYGCTCKQYMNWMAENAKDIKEGYAKKDQPPNGVVQEAKITTKDRNELEDSDFGLVYTDEDGKKIRKYPLTDEEHVRKAVQFFNKAPDEYKEELARNIVKRAKELDMDWENWESLKPYLKETVQESDRYIEAIIIDENEDTAFVQESKKTHLKRFLDRNKYDPKTGTYETDIRDHNGNKIRVPVEITSQSPTGVHAILGHPQKIYINRKDAKSKNWFSQSVLKHEEGHFKDDKSGDDDWERGDEIPYYSDEYNKIQKTKRKISDYLNNRKPNVSIHGAPSEEVYADLHAAKNVSVRSMCKTLDRLSEKELRYAGVIKRTISKLRRLDFIQVRKMYKRASYDFKICKPKLREFIQIIDDFATSGTEFEKTLQSNYKKYADIIIKMQSLERAYSRAKDFDQKSKADEIIKEYNDLRVAKSKVIEVINDLKSQYNDNISKLTPKEIENRLDELESGKAEMIRVSTKMVDDIIKEHNLRKELIRVFINEYGIITDIDSDIFMEDSESSDELIKLNNYPFDKVYVGSPIDWNDKIDVQHGRLFVTPYIGIASIFAGDHSGKNLGIPRGSYNLDYNEWDWSNSKLKKPLSTYHINVQGYPDTKEHEVNMHGYIYTIDIRDLKDHIYMHPWMTKSREALICDFDKVPFTNKIPWDSIAIVNGAPSDNPKYGPYTQESASSNGLTNARLIASRIHAQYKKDSKPPTGNQNCQICTWCAEENFRGGTASPRPVYSPRDTVFNVNGWDIVMKPNKTPIKNKDDVIKKITLSGEGSRWYTHVKWKDGHGGHEFLLLNLDGDVYVMDAQQGFVESITSSEGSKYFDDITYKESFICRLDNKEFNHELFKKNNDPSKILPWDEKLDIPYMKKEGLLSDDDDIQDLQMESYQMEGAWQDIKNGVNPWSNKLYFHVSRDDNLDGKTLKPRVPSYLTQQEEFDRDKDPYFEESKTPRVCFSNSIEGCLNAMISAGDRVATGGDELYVYIPVKPITSYKTKLNKELVKDKDVFDAKSTGEIWVLEPVQLRLYGTIMIDQVSNHKAVKTVNKAGKVSRITYKWHWQVKPKVIKKMDVDIGYFSTDYHKNKQSNDKPVVREGYSIPESYKRIQSFLEGNYEAFDE